MDGAPSFQKTVFDILKFSLVDRPRGHKQDKLNGYTVFIHFFCLCPIDLTIPGGGGTPLYKVYRYVPPQRVWFLSRFRLKTGIDFDNYGLKSGRVFGAGNIYESLQTYFSSQYVNGTTNF